VQEETQGPTFVGDAEEVVEGP
jgi:hypothetical protein